MFFSLSCISTAPTTTTTCNRLLGLLQLGISIKNFHSNYQTKKTSLPVVGPGFGVVVVGLLVVEVVVGVVARVVEGVVLAVVVGGEGRGVVVVDQPNPVHPALSG